MRTIKESLLKRLSLQADEADYQGLTSTGESLTRQIEKYSGNTRTSKDSYFYSEENYQQDIKDCLWDAIIRTADFHDASLDSLKVQAMIDAAAEDLITEMRTALCVSAVGPYEEALPGEESVKSV